MIILRLIAASLRMGYHMEKEKLLEATTQLFRLIG